MKLNSVEDKVENVLEAICDHCRYPIQAPTEEERLTGCCAQCEICEIGAQVHELVAIARANAVPWISVEEQLPGQYLSGGRTQYLVCYTTPNSKQRHVIQSGYWGGNLWSKNFVGEVTHWMPMPKPPKDVQT